MQDVQHLVPEAICGQKYDMNMGPILDGNNGDTGILNES
jgi:hypothetical protein